MAEKTENWRLILDGAQALTAVGQTPFTRISIYEWIWQRYPRSSHDRPSLDPTFQGMVRNATGGPGSLAGTPLIRVGRGQMSWPAVETRLASRVVPRLSEWCLRLTGSPHRR